MQKAVGNLGSYFLFNVLVELIANCLLPNCQLENAKCNEISHYKAKTLKFKHIEIIQSKIFALDSLLQTIRVWKCEGKKIVFTNGCFDLLHLGHIDYLAKAADLGDILIVGLNSDNSVRTLKGKDRPINDDHSRATLLAALSFVDAVILFDEETPYNLIKSIEPDILVKGSDYKTEEIAGHEIVQAKGGKVITIDLLPGYSTTLIEDKILKTKL